MSKLNKKDIIYCIVLAFFFLIFVFILTKFKYYYGSTLDWEAQHITIPEYFRMLFYNTGDLIPDFAFNLGNGQNIFNLSYYGLLSPIILFSYLLPFVRMADYLAVSSIISVIASGILTYIFLRKEHNGKPLVCFLASFSLLFSVSMSFHSHRHIMFINYMPFLILGMFGVNKKLLQGKSWLLILSVFLMIMTSYYYSIAGIICLILYGVYIYISRNKKISIKSFFIDGFKFVLPIIISVICAAIIIIPTFYVILNGRGETFNTISLKDLLLPNFNIKYVLYNSYGMGFTAILIVAMSHLLFKKRENIFLSVVLLLVTAFPFVNYILNATMYIDAKILIPLLPLGVLAIFNLLSDCFEGIHFKKDTYLILGIFVLIAFLFQGYIGKVFFGDLVLLTIFLLAFKYFNKKFLLVIPCVAIPLLVSIVVSKKDTLVDYKSRVDLNSKYGDVVKSIIADDDTFYRINNLKKSVNNMNNLFGNIDFYSSTIYSSTYNRAYNNFYYDIINNPIQSRNRVITSSTSNLMFLIFSGNKYIIKDENPYFGYEFLKKENGQSIYKSEDVFPVIYARSESMNQDDFLKLQYPMQSEALLKYVISSDKTNSDYESNIDRVEVDLSKIRLENVDLLKMEDHYIITAKRDAKGNLTLPEELKNKIIFVRFKMLESQKCRDGDTFITINGVKNKLTCKEWKYHNQNYVFDYTLAMKNMENLAIDFSEGTHKIEDIEVYALDYDKIKNIKSSINEFIFDKEKTRGDFIEGSIDVERDGYFVTSIPFDKGFNIKIDGQEVSALNLNMGFVGSKISKGKHHVSIEYKAPYKNVSLLISFLGLLFALLLILKENITSRKENFKSRF